jgi:kumamolisin
MSLCRLPAAIAAVAVLGLGAGLTASSATRASATSRRPAFTALVNSLPATTDRVVGAYRSPQMAISVALAPRNQAALSRQLAATYTRGSASYHRWLAHGAFDARYAPSAATRSEVASYLRKAGLTVTPSSSPFLVRAVGSSAQVSATFRTTLRTFQDPAGSRYFSNSAAVELPTSLAADVLGVIGLSNTVRERATIARPMSLAHAAASPDTPRNCEAPYPTAAQLSDAVSFGDQFPFGFGGGPDCTGLTPSQTTSIYGAPHIGERGKGAGINLALFELSAYQHSDIKTWAKRFYGGAYHPPLVDVDVDGGPLTPKCPKGDTCPADINGYAGDIEVDADIEMDLTVSPDAHHVIVYNAPDDFTGQTALDEYTAIANADQAAVVSSSWGTCENDVSAAMVQAENVIFEQMALQGQAMFGASGDSGAFSCLRSDTTTIVDTLDPSSQPWVTSVGGTSLEGANPGHDRTPAYPPHAETVWNPDNLCNPRAVEGDQTGFFWCAESGAGGGGSSQWWGRPAYQSGAGVNSPYTTLGNGTTHCALAKLHTPCRESPDISANADSYTPYTEYCTGNAKTPDSVCANIDTTVVGWFPVGGTSLSTPLWSGIIADRDGYEGHRSGNINPLLYQLNTANPGYFFHDITSAGQTTTNNGRFPTTPGYDEATGLGTPRMTALITGRR